MRVRFKTEIPRKQTHRWRRSARKPLRITPGVVVGTAAVVLAVYAVSVFPTIQVMRESGANLSEARLAIHLAKSTNALGNLVLHEAIDKVAAIKGSTRADVALAAKVSAIELTNAGAITSARITPALGAVTVQYTVSGTDGYYDSGTLQTNSDGKVEFNIPPAQSGVEDMISVSAVLSGRSARTLFTW